MERDEFSDYVDEIADVYLEEEREGYDSDLEAFDSYSVRFRAQVHQDMEQFRDRFFSGYELLLKELSMQHKGSSDVKEEIPPNAIKL